MKKQFAFEAKPEILAPAGSYQALLAAVEGGADAVYLGSEKFNARASAENFNGELLVRAIHYSHAHGVAVYMAMNTLLYDRELDEAVELARKASMNGIDGLIVADMGLIHRLRNECPDLSIHVSTQAGIHTQDGLRILSEYGVERVVLPRELSASELKNLTDYAQKIGMETEVFVHGAHCVSFSGQCLFSSMIGDRSGNRGECAQPCRLPYDNSYPLSLKDLSLACHVRELCDMGVTSFKIEGRLKSPHYVYEVTRIFRRLVDEKRDATSDEMRLLANAFSRGGTFTDGYFANETAHMSARRTSRDKENTKNAESGYTPKETKESVSLWFEAKKDRPLKLLLSDRFEKHYVEGPIPEAAQSAEATKQSVTARLAKLGDTPFTLAEQDADVHVEKGLFIPVSVLNDLRRRACDGLLNEPLNKAKIAWIRQGNDPESFPGGNQTLKSSENELFRAPRKSPVQNGKKGKDSFVILSMRAHQSKAVFRFFEHEENRPLLFTSFLALSEDASLLSFIDGVCLPPIIDDRQAVLKKLKEWKTGKLRYAMIENIGHTPLAAEAGLIAYGGMRMNLTNRFACALFAEQGGVGAILSPELKIAQARDIGWGVLTVYGHLPLMLTERCFIRENFGCAQCDKASLSDRMGVRFPMMREWEHRNLILNSRPTYMLDRRKEMKGAGVSGGALIFTCEEEMQTLEILDAFRRCLPPKTDIKRIK